MATAKFGVIDPVKDAMVKTIDWAAP